MINECTVNDVHTRVKPPTEHECRRHRTHLSGPTTTQKARASSKPHGKGNACLRVIFRNDLHRGKRHKQCNQLFVGALLDFLLVAVIAPLCLAAIPLHRCAFEPVRREHNTKKN